SSLSTATTTPGLAASSQGVDANAPIVAGQQLSRYVVLGRIGSGGMGIVYSAHDPKLDRAIALKVLRGDLWDRRGEHRLLREAQAMARLCHPNVVTVLDVGVSGAHLFVAMELVEGGTVASWLREAPRQTAEIVQMFREAGQGLAAAHAAGLVH